MEKELFMEVCKALLEHPRAERRSNKYLGSLRNVSSTFDRFQH